MPSPQQKSVVTALCAPESNASKKNKKNAFEIHSVLTVSESADGLRVLKTLEVGEEASVQKIEHGKEHVLCALSQVSLSL